ncbi:MAG: hypothetical protein ACTHMC_21760 [Pseudobacter sp.]|uniref:hypothetical protein n=1 Tax=Pseudobacter sp. TaxID=2045420 RepID=UPI003F812C7C
MTIKEAILKSLEDLEKISTYNEVFNHIVSKGYYDFSGFKYPESAVSAQLGNFIRNNDTRVKRLQREGSTFAYYLTKNEELLPIPEMLEMAMKHISEPKKTETFHERDLHILLSSYLKNTGVFSKTILHERSVYIHDNNQKWTHPDMVGVQLFRLHSKANQSLLKTVKSKDAFKISSYEIKKEIKTDNDLKKAYFQAVSNSSWANFGYLVAIEIDSSLNEEMARLNRSFGIGIIILNAAPFSSQVLFPSAEKELDFRTMDKLCRNNPNFEHFIEKTEKLVNVEERYYNAMQKELEEFCDQYFTVTSDSAIIQYCMEKKIPIPVDKELSQEGM